MSRTSQNGVLLSLPPELLVQHIFSRLQLRSLASCSSVCRELHDLIDSSMLLTYHKELGVAGMVDNLKCSYGEVPLEDRLQLLRESQARWDNLDWKWSMVIDVPQAFGVDTDTFKLGRGDCGVLYFERFSEEEDLVSLLSLLLPESENDQPRWEQIDFGKTIIGYTIALEENDLFVGVTSVPLAFGSGLAIQVHLLQHSTRQPHHDALTPVIDLRTFLVGHQFDVPQASVAIGGKHMAIWFCNKSNGDGTFSVWDWRIGEKIVEVDARWGEIGMTFLTEDLVMVGNSRTMLLDIYDIHRMSSTSQNSDGKPQISLGLPTFDDSYYVESVSFGWNPHFFGHGGNPRHPRRPFTTNPMDSIIVVEVTTSATEYANTECHFVVQRRSLLALSARPAGIHSGKIPWEEWGPKSVRMFPSDSDFARSSSGARYCLHWGTNLGTLEFGTLKRQGLSGDTAPQDAEPKDINDLVHSSHDEDSPFGSVQTELPFHSSTRQDLKMEQSFDSIFIDDTRIVGFRDVATSRQLHVYYLG